MTDPLEGLGQALEGTLPFLGSGSEVTTPEPEVPAEEPKKEVEAQEYDAAAEIEELKQQLKALEKRNADTFDWGTQQNQSRIIADALLTAQERQRELWEERRKAERDLAPPTVSAEEKEKLYEDPDLLLAKVRDWVGYGVKYTLAQVAPYLQRSEAVAQVKDQVVNMAAKQAWYEARSLSERDGISGEEFDELYQHTYQVLADHSRGSRDNYTAMILEPQAIATAAAAARRQYGGGPPVKPTRVAKTAGVGEEAPPPRKAPVARSPVISRFEQATGIPGMKFTDDELRTAAAKRDKYAGI